MADWRIDQGDVLEVLRGYEAESVNCVVTSPPYWGLRNYGAEGQIGLERTPEEYVAKIVAVFAEVRRVLRKDGTVWLNLGDSYAGGRSGPEGDKGTLDGSRHNQNESRLARESFRRDRRDTGDVHHKSSPGLKPKDLVGIPWMVAFALRADGWYLRSEIIWSKPNPMPESVTDRPTKAHEYLFLLSKSRRYYYDQVAIAEPANYPEGSGNTRPYEVEGQREGENANLGGGLHKVGPRETRNRRTVWKADEEEYLAPDVWEIATEPFAGHFATFPTKLVEPCILAGCPEGGVVLDPFAGSGTTLMVALRHNRRAIGVELNPAYVAMAKKRIEDDCPLFNGAADG